jgi:hypothetical protein
MDCPICGLFNPPSAQMCDCGYDFEGKILRAPLVMALEGLDAVGKASCFFIGFFSGIHFLVLLASTILASLLFGKYRVRHPKKAADGLKFYSAGLVVVFVFGLFAALLGASR